MKEFFGYGRSRSGCGKGDIVKRHFNDYVNCIHTLVGGGWKTMEVLVAEFDMSEIKYIGQMSSSQNSRVIDPEGISYAVTNGHKDGEPKIIERDTPMKGNYTEPRICTMVGRDPNNPSSRARSDHYEQFLEMGDDVSNTLTSVQKDNLLAEPRLIEVGNLVPQTGKWMSPQRGRVFSPEGIAPSMDTCSGGNREPKIIDDIYKDREARVYDDIAPTMRSGHDTMKVAEPEIWQNVADELKQMATEARKEPIEVTINEHGSLRPHKLDKAKTGISEFQVENEEDTASTLISARPNKTYGYTTSYRIRKLTPRECFRLMGVTETDIDKIQQSGVSQSQQYKMAGNSIVVDCLYHMFRKMFTETACESQQLSLF